MQVGLRGGLVDGQDGVDDVGCELARKGRVELGGEGRPGDVQKELSVNFLGQLEGIEELQHMSDVFNAFATGPTFKASILASSNPSVIIRGCSPSEMYLSACLSSSPTNITTEVVPSPQISSWAVAARAIITAVGFCICISRSKTLPSLVSLI